jgi:hypothetical protein
MASAAEMPKVLPGEWLTTMTTRMTTMPNVPPKVAAMLRQRQGKPHLIRHCITPADAARGPESAMAETDCKMRNVNYGGGRMSAETVCNNDGRVTRNKMSGTWSPTAYDMEGAMSSSGGDEGPMAMTMHIEGKRVGPVCSAASK